jgi:RNA polymerase sigma-70 factor (ECF subfamily)
VVIGYVFNKEDAEEIVQDCLLAALRGLGDFKSESSIKTWVYSIAINKSKDLIKHKSRAKRSGQTLEILDSSAVDYYHPGLQLESNEELEFMFKGLNALPENQRIALTMAKFDHKSQKEIAAFMETSSKAVESLLSRAKANFKKHLQTRDYEEN